MATPETRKFKDPLGRLVTCVPQTEGRGGFRYSVEVVDNGEVVDHYTLYGNAALQYTSTKLGWEAMN